MFLHWLLLVSLANSCAGSLELLELRNTVKQPKGLCGDIFSSCVWLSFDSLHCGMFLHDVSKSPSIFANFPIYGYKDEFLVPPHDHLFFPCSRHSCISSYVPSILAWILHQSKSQQKHQLQYRLKKAGTRAASKLKIASGSHYSRCRLALLSQKF